MTAEIPNGNHRDGLGASVGAPSVSVAAPAAVARRLVAILKHDGLEAAPMSPSDRKGDLDALVVAVESPALADVDLAEMRRRHPSTRVVVVVATASPAEARQLLVDDVPGLVLEGQAEVTLALAVRAVHAGQISYPAEVMPTQLKSALSKREKQVLGMVVLGFTNAEIAAKLYVSQSTVKSHLSSAFATIGVKSRKEAVALILDPNAGFGTGILAITGSASQEPGDEAEQAK